jgi:hypothetical protein
MGVSYEYETTIAGLIKDLRKLGKEHGVSTKITLPSPGFYDPNFEGRNSKLTAIFSKREDHVLIVQKYFD